MSDRFHALFGICRNRGGTKKACYQKAIKAVGGTKKRKSPKRRRSWCKRWGYSARKGVPVCRERR